MATVSIWPTPRQSGSTEIQWRLHRCGLSCTLLRLGLLPEGYIYPVEDRPVRDLSRKRMQLVQYRTAQILAIENLFSRHTGGQMRGEQVKRLDQTQVSGFGFTPDVGVVRNRLFLRYRDERNFAAFLAAQTDFERNGVARWMPRTLRPAEVEGARVRAASASVRETGGSSVPLESCPYVGRIGYARTADG
jgi:hypothetical protein